LRRFEPKRRFSSLADCVVCGVCVCVCARKRERERASEREILTMCMHMYVCIHDAYVCSFVMYAYEYSIYMFSDISITDLGRLIEQD
jgi:hypothetical protein